MKQVSQILPDLISPRGRRKPAAPNGTMNLFPPEEIVLGAWEHLAGRQLAARTRPLRLFGDRLIVEVPDRVWQRQLRPYENALLDRIYHLLGDRTVTAIEWRVNPALAAGAIPAPPRKPPARETDASLESAAQAIADPELRELFLRTAQKMAR